MDVKNNRVVSFLYSIRDNNSPEVENSGDSIPMAFLCGKGNILPALEKAMIGHTAGDTLQVTVGP